jgi:mRNA-degrading endonuclease RelE of RelBE toxin-antitoxin system
MRWTLAYLPEAEKDPRALDGNQRILVQKAIKKVPQNPLPAEENGKCFKRRRSAKQELFCYDSYSFI